MPFEILSQVLTTIHPSILMMTTGLLVLTGVAMWMRARDVFLKWVLDLKNLGQITEDELLRPWVSNAYHRVHTMRLAAYALFSAALLVLALILPLGTLSGLLATSFSALLVGWSSVRLLISPSGTLYAEYKALGKLFPDSVPRIEEFRKIPHTPWNKKP